MKVALKCSLVSSWLSRLIETYLVRTNIAANQWGTVCDFNWDFFDAQVVCRELGFLGVVGARTRAYFGRGTGQIWMNDVHCYGYESQLQVLYACGYALCCLGRLEQGICAYRSAYSAVGVTTFATTVTTPALFVVRTLWPVSRSAVKCITTESCLVVTSYTGNNTAISRGRDITYLSVTCY